MNRNTNAPIQRHHRKVVRARQETAAQTVAAQSTWYVLTVGAYEETYDYQPPSPTKEITVQFEERFHTPMAAMIWLHEHRWANGYGSDIGAECYRVVDGAVVERQWIVTID